MCRLVLIPGFVCQAVQRDWADCVPVGAGEREVKYSYNHHSLGQDCSKWRCVVEVQLWPCMSTCIPCIILYELCDVQYQHVTILTCNSDCGIRT